MASTSRHRTSSRIVPAPREDLCLEFADTRYWRGSEPPTETLRGFGDVIVWCENAKLLDRSAVVELRSWERHQGSQAAGLFGEVLDARETIYRLFSSVVAGKAVSDRDIDTLNRLLEEAPRRGAITITDSTFMWQLPPPHPTFASILAPVLWSAADLLVGTRLTRVRQCANEKCQWLFLDDSKSGTRRWCSMSSCGNRAKAHRHYMRKPKASREETR